MIKNLFAYCKTIPIFFIVLSLTLLYVSLIPNIVVVAEDTGDYMETARNLSQTLYRPIGFPLLLRLGLILGNLKYIVIIHAFMCAVIFQVIYTLTKSKWIIWILLAFGAYWIYVPYMLSDLSFAFFVIVSYYCLVKKRFELHFLFIGLASLFKPTLAWFFIAEPFIIWFKYKDLKLAVYAFFMVFIFTSFTPMKNFFEHGIWTHSQILKLSINEYYFAQADNKILYMIYSLFSNGVSTHWNSFFSIYGIFKGDTLWINLVNWMFAGIYFVIWLRFIIGSLMDKKYFELIFVAYFVAPTIFCHAGGGRWRLPFEFLLL